MCPFKWFTKTGTGFWFVSSVWGHFLSTHMQVLVDVHLDMKQLPPMWKSHTAPAAFFTHSLNRNDEKGSRDVLRSRRRVERSQLSKGEQSVTCMVIVKRRKRGWGERARRLGPSQACWKKIRWPPDGGARHPPPRLQASYPEPSRSGGLALSHKSQCHSRGLQHAATCLCLHVQLCVKVFSLTLYLCVSVPTPSLSLLFSRFYSLYIFFDSDSREWRKERQGWVFSDAVLFESRLKFGSWGFLSFVVYWFIRCQGLLEILEKLVLFVQISCKLSLITALAVLILHQYLTFGLLNWPFLKPLLLWQVSITRPIKFWIQMLKPCMGL